jgi:L-ornithine Nalpha-acyltransferase
VSHLPTEAARAAPPGAALWSGALEVRLAASDADLDAAQALRYRVFYDEMGARPSAEMARIGRDFDRLDADCDHLLVLDHGAGGRVVGTYRLIRSDVARRHGGFYTAAEYDISSIAAHPGEVLELGRSCVAPSSRNRSTMQLLWRGIADYVFRHDIALMFGCASLPGTDADALAVPLSYLHHHHLAPPALRPRALPGRYVAMRRLESCAFDATRARAGLPPLIKGYLRLGGRVGDGAAIDRQFNTTDVCVVVETDRVTDKYYRHYERRTREDVAPG